MNVFFIIALLFVGLLLLTLEIVVLPGGISGICGGLIIILTVWQSYELYGKKVGLIILLSCIVVCSIMVFLMLKSRTWKRFSLNEESDGHVNKSDLAAIHVGDRGKTLSRLAPAGKAIINDKIIEVHSIGDFIEEHREIEVTDIEGYLIHVKKADED